MIKTCAVPLCVGLILMQAGSHVPAPQEDTPLPPTEALKSALAPYAATRNQPNDLTDADKVALGIGMAQAAHDCRALSTHTAAFASNADELIALGQLCIFGQEFELGRAVLVDYLALPKPPEREKALLLLVRALLGLKQPESAEPQLRLLLRDYPYDAPIHFAIDQVIDQLEDNEPDSDTDALQLCATQNAATLPLLANGRDLKGKDGDASAATLFEDAVRCAALAHAHGKPDGLEQLSAITQEPSWSGTADLAPMRAALERQQMVGRNATLPSLHGRLVKQSALVPRTVSLRHGTVLLVPFALWSPNTVSVLLDLARSVPQQPIYAITSWRANSGGDDVPSRRVLEGLRSWQRSMPGRVAILIVPQLELDSFYADSFPAGILIRDRTVLSNSVLSGGGAERLLVTAMKSRTGDR